MGSGSHRLYGLAEFHHFGFSVASSFVISKLWTKILLPTSSRFMLNEKAFI